ncbi:Cochaperone protein [Diaporthe australafricana]|uniref:Cochaperone protein n=1 Tax=Diaporthe australafricana TaxID=127596 RepID=A0ABR3X564_9PEZI
MSSYAFRDAGFKAIEQRNWPEAIENLSKAIDQSKSPAWLLARSQAFMETGQLEKAIRDAEYAYCTATERGNDKSRKQMIEASHRRSVCHFRLKEYANADICAVWAQRLAKGVAVKESKNVQQEGVNDKGYYFATVEQAMAEEGEKKGSSGQDQMSKLSELMGGASDKNPYAKDWNKAQLWRSQVLRFLEPLPEDDPARKITISLTPVKPSLLEEKRVKPSSSISQIESAKSDAATSEPNIPKNTPAVALRTQFYQTDTSITVSVFTKFPNKAVMDAVEVRFPKSGKYVLINGLAQDPPALCLEFHDLIKAQESKFRVASMKVELTLVKQAPGKWPDFGTQRFSLPDDEQDADTMKWFHPSGAISAPAGDSSELLTAKEEKADSKSVASEPNPEQSEQAAGSTKASTLPKAPSYPSSSKSGPKDWDSIAKEDKDEDDDATDVDSFFKHLFKNSTPEQQRAMMKSYTESNGTALSTDWSSVAKGKVETKPPNGMEAKKWA